MSELDSAVNEVFGEFLDQNLFRLRASIACESSEHRIFENESMKIRFSFGVQDRLQEVTVTLGSLSAPDSDQMWHPLAYVHAPSDSWLHVADFNCPLTDEEYDAWVLQQFHQHGPAVVGPPSLKGDLVRYLRQIDDHREAINVKFGSQLRVVQAAG